MQSLAKFAVTGVVLAAALWFSARFATSHLASLGAHRDEAALLVLIVVGALIYAAAILGLFGPRWLRALVRG